MFRYIASVVGLVLAITVLTIEPIHDAVLPAAPPDWKNPTTWTDEALAAQTIFTCSSSLNLSSTNKNVERGLGGIALVGNSATKELKTQITNLKKRAVLGVPPFIASDEEGGNVQRLRTAIYKLPTATTMGTWTDAKLELAAFNYGTRMKDLGIDFAFSPVADLNVPGFFISKNRRGFGSNPEKVAVKVTAWAAGLQRAGVVPVIKHWPGHGSSEDTHAKPGTLSPIFKLQEHDLIPFKYAFAHGVKAAMVGHLFVPGLTEPKTPTSRSKAALALLREQLGPDGLIITDSLSMGGGTKGLKRDISEAAIRSLEAGVDIALVCTGPKSLISDVTAALTQGRLSRNQMVAKAQRILKWKESLGIIP